MAGVQAPKVRGRLLLIASTICCWPDGPHHWRQTKQATLQGYYFTAIFSDSTTFLSVFWKELQHQTSTKSSGCGSNGMRCRSVGVAVGWDTSGVATLK
ncbi:hypothetical protein AMELA_G00026080 [Ameiurus melas]|uniref:Uncharacterized protein n=1 Tax=Ameiurus melas TaxID=219545 RepID=A0A7J6BCN8_AMEME|nr:hypothetical protein AMELA_G00026080 [Ameiurus melas]